MKYFTCNKFQVEQMTNSIEFAKFVDYTNNLIRTKPFLWHNFISIFKNKVVYFEKNETLIISLLKLSDKQVETLFIVLKEYLKRKLFKKIIYKKEFIIIHFLETYSVTIFTNQDFWKYIPYYFDLHNLGYLSLLNVQITNIDTLEKAFCPLILLNDDLFISFSPNNVFEEICNYQIKYYANKGKNVVAFNYNKNNRINQLLSIIVK